MNDNREVVVEISNRTIVRVLLWIAAAVATYKFIGKTSHVLTLIAISGFLALALNPVVGSVSRRLRIKSRAKATAVAYLSVLVLLGGFFALVIPPLVQQTRDFVKDVPSTVESFQQQDNSLSNFVKRYDVDQRLNQGAKDFASQYSNFGGALVDTGKRVASTFVSIIAVIVLTFMILVEGPGLLNRFWKFVPANKREHNQALAYKIYRTVTGFVNGQVILALAGGSFAFLTLLIASSIMDVTINALALAGIVAVFALIPMFGTFLGAMIVVLACLLSSGSLALVMLIYFVVYQQLENISLQPYIQSRLNELSPMLIFMAALLGVGLNGILGAIVAIPIAGTIKILINDYFSRRRSART